MHLRHTFWNECINKPREYFKGIYYFFFIEGMKDYWLITLPGTRKQASVVLLATLCGKQRERERTIEEVEREGEVNGGGGEGEESGWSGREGVREKGREGGREDSSSAGSCSGTIFNSVSIDLDTWGGQRGRCCCCVCTVVNNIGLTLQGFLIIFIQSPVSFVERAKKFNEDVRT